ncbi:MAG: acetyltransferase [Leptolyngbyaceae cyanobacterium SM1_1_3]|nr:acetyltransferase [Leptolyngbyaceae cyanobacterium SM1_1_3]NJN03435.1 acetyltransferase [Leptolyngbyaceae cyanobacterium RM1_1_2]NJO08803.1 acetyltransferase [Leptolyngbyaceae cyanobacterium SL_1_1]
MLMQNKETGILFKVTDTEALINPTESEATGQHQAGQEEQPPESVSKAQLVFPSGEQLPLCWVDPDYRQ